MLALVLALAPAFTGPRACEQCHPARFQSHIASRHAQALRPASSIPDLASRFNARPVLERSGVAFVYSNGTSGMNVSISQGNQQQEFTLQWIFGAGAQAVTPVGRHAGRYVEHRISWYRAPAHAARTLGHPAGPSSSLAQAFGIRQDSATITRCFGCHATNVQPGPDLSAMIPGVTCERCHGPGAGHVRSPSKSNILTPAGSAFDSVQFCAGCHRGTSSGASPADPATVRFQPIGLTASRCFQASRKLTCLTCHDPHEDASHDASFYSDRCLGCHATGGKPVVRCGRATRQDCVPCHMKQKTPFPFLTFTDHHIRTP